MPVSDRFDTRPHRPFIMRFEAIGCLQEIVCKHDGFFCNRSMKARQLCRAKG